MSLEQESNQSVHSLTEQDKKDLADLKFIPEYTDAEDIPSGNSVRALISGVPGSGKTEFCFTCAGETVLINIGKGIETKDSIGLRQRNPNWGKIKVVEIEKIFKKGGKENPTDEEMIEAISDTVVHATRTTNVRNICIDDMTEFRFYALWRGMEIMKNEGKSQSYVTSKKYDLPLPVVQDFGAEMNLVEDFLRWLNDDAYTREYNIIITAHTRHVYKKILDDRGKPIMGIPPVLVRELPGFTGQTFPDYIPRLFSIVGQLEPNVDNQGRTKPRLRLSGDSSKCIKHRYSGILPEFMFNPRFDKIVEAIKSNRPIDNEGKISTK